MSQSLYYLFLSGLILGAGPCLGFCAPVLTGFIAAYKPSTKQALISYLFFSGGKLFSYMAIGALCGVISGLWQSGFLQHYFRAINVILGVLVLLIGGLTLAVKEPLSSKYCAFFAKGHLRNAGVLGLLAGFSPCLPFLGILNYVMIIVHSPLEGLFYAMVFGIGTSISPLILLAGLAGKLSGDFTKQKLMKNLIKIISALVLIYLGLKIIL